MYDLLKEVSTGTQGGVNSSLWGFCFSAGGRLVQRTPSTKCHLAGTASARPASLQRAPPHPALPAANICSSLPGNVLWLENTLGPHTRQREVPERQGPWKQPSQTLLKEDLMAQFPSSSASQLQWLWDLFYSLSKPPAGLSSRCPSG